MCGIAGIIHVHSGAEADRRVLESMSRLIAHRGRDHEGFWTSRRCGLAHRRLTITDLVTGQQPLSNEDGSVWVVFNGEIYNYRQLRKELEQRGHRFVTQTDTEVIPHLYEEHGDDFVRRMEGNWAMGRPLAATMPSTTVTMEMTMATMGRSTKKRDMGGPRS